MVEIKIKRIPVNGLAMCRLMQCVPCITWPSALPLVLMLLFCVLTGRAAEPDKTLTDMWDGGNRAVIPMNALDTAPKADGVIGVEEWKKSVRFAGFIRCGEDRLLVADRPGFVNIATDGSNLYIAVRTATPNNDPGGGLVALAKAHDGEVCKDDSVEVALIPDSDSQRGFHLRVNSAGVIFGQMVTYKPERYDIAWNCPDILVGATVRSGWWELELKIPFASIGNPKQSVKLNVARNWQGLGPSALVSTPSYMDPAKMIALSWQADAPAIQVNELGAVGEGLWNVDVGLSHLPEGHAVTLAMLVRLHVWKPENGKSVRHSTTGIFEEKTFSAPGVLKGTYTAPTRDLHSLNVLAKDAATGKIFYSRTFSARKGAEVGDIPPTVEADLAGCGLVQCFYYPGYNRASVVVIPHDSLTVKEINVRIGKKAVLAERQGKKYKARLDVPEKEGVYDVDVTLVSEDSVKHEFPKAVSLTKKIFPWQNNQRGTAKVVLPPFKPITQKGNDLDVVLRRYRVNTSGLLDALTALDRDILASPMRYELVSNGKTHAFNGSAPVITVKDQGYQADITSKSTAPDGTIISTCGTLEYDGFLWNEVRLDKVDSRTIDRLTLVVPLKDHECPLFHAVTANGIRHNPSMALPKGDGLAWSGDKLHRSALFGQSIIHPQFVPYVWLGAERRGLSWFMDTSYGMRLDEQKPALRIVRNNGTLNLEIDFINRPVQLKNGHAFAYGFHATPVKEQDKRMRQWLQSAYPEGVEGMITLYKVNDMVGGYQNGWSRFPYQEDYTCVDAVTRVLTTATGIDELEQTVTAWDAKHSEHLQEIFAHLPNPNNRADRTYLDWWLSCKKHAMMLLKKTTRPGIPRKYSDPVLVTYLEEIPTYFQTEWVSQRTGYLGAMRAYMVPSYMDYIIEGYYQELKHGIIGVYLDDMFLICCKNSDTLAKVDEEGFVHVETGLLRMRELVKRISVMQHEMGLDPRWLQIHMTNATLVPAFSFATSLLCWEDKFGEDEFQDRFALDYIRAANLGTQVGAEAVALDGIHRRTTDPSVWKNSKFEFLSRTQMALTLPNGMKTNHRVALPNTGVHAPTFYSVSSIISRFETWAEDCDFVPYFEDDKAISGVPEGVLMSSYRRPGKVMLMLGNLGEASNMTLKLDRSKLKLLAGATLYNAETNEEIKDGVVTLPRRDFAILWAGVLPRKAVKK